MGATPSPAGSGGGGRTGLWVGLGIAAVAVIGLLAFAVTSLLGDDDENNAADRTTTTSQPVETTTTTEGTTTTAAPTGPQSTDDAAKSVVQIYTMADGLPVCVGSGTIISNDGFILTNAHVVFKDEYCPFDSIQVGITDSADQPATPRYLAEVYAIDRALDLAVIGIAYDLDGNPIEVNDLPAIPIGDSDQVGLGDVIRVLGYPSIGGDTITFTSGSVSGFTAEAGVGERAFIKTDTTISGGNSGGLAINDDYEIIGVPTQASAGASLDIADCRVVADTNGDGVIDSNDNCIPIGGFLNGIRPVNLALGLIEDAKARNVVEMEINTEGPIDVLGEASFGAPHMTSAIDESGVPVDVVSLLPEGAPQVCASFEYSGMQDGVPWDALWVVEGELVEDISFINIEWTGGESGSYWVCATGGAEGLPWGLYELQLFVQGEFFASNTVHIGAWSSSDMVFVNDLSFDVCYFQIAPSKANGWGPDDLGPEQIVFANTEFTLHLVHEQYDWRATNCPQTEEHTVFGIDLGPGARVNLSGG